MIPAGTLKYNLKFLDNISVQSDSGFDKVTKVELFKCKAAKVKSTGKFDLNAKELFHSNELIFKLRYNKLLTDKLIVGYDNEEYIISFLDKNLFDNTVQITLSKIND
jgi:hypothetical protein